MINAFSECKRLDCASHRLNTILRTAWNSTEDELDSAKRFLTAAHKLVKYAKKCDLQSQLPYFLKEDIKVRWNSLYFTLKSIQKNYDDIRQKLAGSDALIK